ncbi:general odorant-binding protein 70 [Onthophagus taurus]|uniref:general odorant-binding protein 70 n=1 Tax=Onthophagus taurus TaxID=166361 RepID=UPI000C20C174|nr:general odorant-binding protein 70 [Onthophagus taurus]
MFKVICVIIFFAGLSVSTINAQIQKCKVPPSAPKNIEKVINKCQDEIRLAILSEALSVFNFDEILREDANKTETTTKSFKTISRSKRQVFTDEETKIAGCLLHCVYRRMGALNEVGFPTIEGLVNLYAQGVKDRGYLLATLRSVATCLTDAKAKYVKTIESLQENGKTCAVAYDVFNCVSDRIGEYCGQSP